MKKKTWDNPNKMHFESLHKAFNRQTKIITTGNVIADTQISSYIRPFNMTRNPVGEEKEPGYLQNWDLKWLNIPEHIKEFVRENGRDKYLIVYLFYHHNNGENIKDGVVVTEGHRGNYKHLKTFYLNNTEKAISVVNEARKYITKNI